MRRRRGIMGLNGGAGIPVIIATATGNPLTFETDMVKPLKSLVIPFTPIQAAGTPSYDNPLPISGWTWANVYNEEIYDVSATPKLTINWQTEAGTIYGGRLTINENGTGLLRKSYTYRDMSKFSSISAPSGSGKWAHRFNLKNWATTWDKAAGTTNMVCDVCRTVADATSNYTVCGISSTSDMYVYDDTISTVAEFKAKYAGHYLAYALRSWENYNLTEEQVGQLVTILGTNNIWTDTNGTNTATYLKHQS